MRTKMHRLPPGVHPCVRCLLRGGGGLLRCLWYHDGGGRLGLAALAHRGGMRLTAFEWDLSWPHTFVEFGVHGTTVALRERCA
jgi:hypothetical protein